jgi:predicted amidophosphoribosyltransferase
VLDLLLPRRCVVCGAGGTQLCGSCLAGLPRIGPPLCERCGAPTAWPVHRCRECAGRRLAFASARAAVAYDAAVRRVVAGWKEHGLRGLAGDAAALVGAVVPPPGAVTVTFVPPDSGRRLERGHHPAERLAEALAAHWSLPCTPLLERTGASRRQRGLELAERRKNVARAFRATARAPGRVLLVDDVYTSGATVSAAASALRVVGARTIDVVTFARAVRDPGMVLQQG